MSSKFGLISKALSMMIMCNVLERILRWGSDIQGDAVVGRSGVRKSQRALDA